VLRTLLVLSILIAGVPLAIYSPFYGLLLYLWNALFRPEFFVWFDLAPFRVSLILGLILVVRSAMDGKYPNLSHPLSLGAVAFLVLALMAQVTAFNADLGWMWIDYFARVVVVSLLAITLIDTRQKLFLAVAVMAGSFGFYSAKAGLGSIIGGGVQFAAGLAGSFGDNNGYALGIAIILPFLIAVAQNAPHRWIRIGFFIAAPLSAFAVVSLFSRGGLLAVGAGAVVLAFFQRKRVRSLVVLATIVLGGYYFAPIPEGWFERIETIQTYEEVEDESAIGRLYFWGVAVEMAKANALGVGLKNFEAAYNRYDTSGGAHGVNRAVHSSHFQVLAETGFPGAALWVTIFLMAFFFIARIRRRSRDPRLSKGDASFILTMANAMAASMVGFLIGGSFLSAALNDVTWLTFALIASLDRISLRLCADAATAPVAVDAGAATVAADPRRAVHPAFTFSRR
jgi:probable O-glycosylation ligase (exosortase A-associated)